MSLYKEDRSGQDSMESLLEEILSGSEDQTLNASTKVVRFFNPTTINNARIWLFHHPDDAALVPDSTSRTSRQGGGVRSDLGLDARAQALSLLRR